MKPERFPTNIINAIRESKILGIRAGIGDHRIIGIWAVVVEGRVFVRSWGLKPQGWYEHSSMNHSVSFRWANDSYGFVPCKLEASA